MKSLIRARFSPARRAVACAVLFSLLSSGSTFAASLLVNGGTTTVTTATPYINGITVKNGTLVVDAGGLIDNNNTSNNQGQGLMIVGQTSGDNGFVSVINGGKILKTNSTTLGLVSGSTGTVTVSGAGSSFTTWTNMKVGAGGTGSLTVTGGATSNAFTGIVGELAGSTGTVNVSGAGSVFSTGSHLLVGNSGTGTLNITNGGVVTTNGANSGGHIGYAAGSVGTVLVDGAGSRWRAWSQGIIVGQSGTGTLTLSNGSAAIVGPFISIGENAGSVGTLSILSGANLRMSVVGGASGTFGNGVIGQAAGSTGTATVDGANSSWNNLNYLSVGASGNGTLTVSGGGKVNVTAPDAGVDIGREVGSTGLVTVTGAGSSLSATDTVRVGGLGNGTLMISNGGTVSGGDGVIGDDAGSTGTATVTGAGSTWNNTNSLVIGVAGNGTLTISNDGTVNSEISGIGTDAGSTGAATVTGAGSTWNNTTGLYVGYEGAGTLSVINGGTVNSGSLVLAAIAGSSGTATVDGGTINTGSITIGSGGTLNYNSTSLTAGAINATDINNAGQFNINTRAPIGGSDDARTIAATIANQASGTINVNLDNNASVTFNGPVTNDGTFKVTQLAGTSGGVTTFTDTFINNGTFNQDPTTTHFAELFNYGQFIAGPGDVIIVDNGFVNHGMVDIFGGADLFGDYSGTGSLQFHIGSGTDHLYFHNGFSGSLELIFDPDFFMGGGEKFIYFGDGAYLTELLIGGVSYGSFEFSESGFLTGRGGFTPGKVPDATETLTLLSLSLGALAAFRCRRV